MPPELRSDAGAELSPYAVSAGSPLGGQVRSRWRALSARHPIGVFLLKRTLAGIATLFVASLLVFLATNALPGNVAETVLGKNANPRTVAHLEAALGLDRSLISQYFSWLGGILHGDLGDSAVAVARGSSPASINSIIGTPLLNSLILGGLATLILIPLSLAIGVYTGVRAGKRADHVVSTITLLLGSLPEFVLGTFLVVIFFTQLDLLPPVALASGQSPLAEPTALILPIVTLLGVSLAFASRQVRAGMIEAVRQDFVTSARLNGLPERRVMRRYALRNALAPSVQTFAQAIQYLIGGIIVVEAVFAYPGIGQLLVNAVTTRDATEVQAIALLLAAIYIVINILADLLVVFLVPKLRTNLS